MSTQEQPSEPKKISTKACQCGSSNLIKLETLNLKHCAECGADIAWLLDEGQAPLNGSHRASRKTQGQDQ